MQRHILMKNPGLSDINPLVCGSETCERGHTFGPATRHYYLFHYVVSGKGRFTSPRGEYEVKAGQLFVIRPGEVTVYSADLADPWYYCWIGFETSLNMESLLLGEDILHVSDCSHLFEACALADRLEEGREWFICGKLFELLAVLRDRASSQKSDAARYVRTRYVRMAENYIQSQYLEPIRIEYLSRRLNLNRSYFSKIFKEVTGKSPQRYLVDFRLEKAAELLGVHRLSPGEAARQVGYPDLCTFSRMFRSRYGVSPRDYGVQSRNNHDGSRRE